VPLPYQVSPLPRDTGTLLQGPATGPQLPPVMDIVATDLALVAIERLAQSVFDLLDEWSS
jgi:hypothetical protein